MTYFIYSQPINVSFILHSSLSVPFITVLNFSLSPLRSDPVSQSHRDVLHLQPGDQCEQLLLHFSLSPSHISLSPYHVSLSFPSDQPLCRSRTVTYFIYSQPINVSCSYLAYPRLTAMAWLWNTSSDVNSSRPTERLHHIVIPVRRGKAKVRRGKGEGEEGEGEGGRGGKTPAQTSIVPGLRNACTTLSSLCGGGR